MIDRIARNRLHEQLSQVALGLITGFEFENNVLSLPTSDPIVLAINRTLRELIDENDSSLGPIFCEKSEMRAHLSRWLLFLESECEYQWPDTKLPPGILDFYKPDIFERLTGAGSKNRKSISQFKKVGEYEYWPFLHQRDFANEQSKTKQ